MIHNWTVIFSNKAYKQAKRLSIKVLSVLRLLVHDLETKGPAPGSQWPNYGKLKGNKSKDCRHCHMIKGRPTYVCCWETDKNSRTIEVYYVGSHEKAPY